MKMTFSAHPPQTVPYRKFQWTGSGGTAIKHVDTVLLFALFGSWVGVMIYTLFLIRPLKLSDLLATVGFAAMGTGMFLWMTIPWAILWCLVYWCWLGGRTARRLAIYCVGWGVGQGIMLALWESAKTMNSPDVFYIALGIWSLIGVVAGLICYPVIWWIWRERSKTVQADAM